MYCFYFLNIKYTRGVTLNHGRKWKLGMSQVDVATEREKLSLKEKGKQLKMAIPAPIEVVFVCLFVFCFFLHSTGAPIVLSLCGSLNHVPLLPWSQLNILASHDLECGC